MAVYWRVMSLSVILVGLYAGIPSPASAELILNAGVRGAYEDNILGAPSGSGTKKQGDFYTAMTASVGGYTKVTEHETYLFVVAGGEQYLFDKLHALDSRAGILSAGIYQGLGSIFSLQLTGKGRIRDFEDRARDGISGGGSAELKEQLTSKLWIKESYEYERNTTESEFFSYTSHTLGLSTGYLLTPRVFLTSGYAYLMRNFGGGSGFETRSHIASAGLTFQLMNKLYLNLGYDRQFNTSNVAGTNYQNNVYTAGVAFSY